MCSIFVEIVDVCLQSCGRSEGKVDQHLSRRRGSGEFCKFLDCAERRVRCDVIHRNHWKTVRFAAQKAKATIVCFFVSASNLVFVLQKSLLLALRVRPVDEGDFGRAKDFIASLLMSISKEDTVVKR